MQYFIFVTSIYVYFSIFLKTFDNMRKLDFFQAASTSSRAGTP